MQRDYEIKSIMCNDLDPRSFGLFYLIHLVETVVTLASLADMNIISTVTSKYKS